MNCVVLYNNAVGDNKINMRIPLFSLYGKTSCS